MSEETQISTEKIGTESEKITEVMPEIKREKGQRGLDKAPRRFNPNSLRNLKQYQNIITEETENSSNWIWILVGIIAVVIGILIWRIYEWLKEKKNDGGSELKYIED